MEEYFVKHSEIVDSPAPAPRKPGTFAPGHVRVGGRKKGTKSWSARAIAEEYGCNPARVLLDVVVKGRLPAIKGRPQHDVSDADRLDALKTLMSYMHPKLNAQTITGANDGPLAVAALDVTELLKDPELARAAQRLALGITSASIANSEAEWDDHGNRRH